MVEADDAARPRRCGLDDFDAEDLPWPWSWLAEGVGTVVLVGIILAAAWVSRPLHGALTRWLEALT